MVTMVFKMRYVSNNYYVQYIVQVTVVNIKKYKTQSLSSGS